MRHHFFKTTVSSLVLTGLMVGSLMAALTADQKKELKEITNDITKVNGLITKKKYDDAQTAIEDVESKLEAFIKDAELKDTDPVIKPVKNQLTKAKEKLEKASNKRELGFEKNVAPILANKCVECHSDEPKGGLRLDTFEGLEKGGRNGVPVTPGNAEESLLVQRLVTQNEQLRMPKDGAQLTEKEVAAIVSWINDGAKFEGDKTATMSALSKASSAKPGEKKPGFPKKMEVNRIEKETGKETVHFTQDIMPELVDTCGRCHNDRTKRSGFSVMSFEKLMKGGDTGVVIVNGSLEKSRLWRLINGPDGKTPVMPAGNQTGITRKWYQNVKTWIEEGAKYDGGDPKKDFPTLEQREAAALARYTPEQWRERRRTSTDTEWRKTFPKVEPAVRESGDFLLFGDVSAERLEQIDKWASEHVAYLKSTFKVKDDTIWRGKLGVFVFKERFGYEEFNNSVHKREVPREVIGHSQVTATMDEAFIALQDVGDSMSDSSPGMQVNVIDQVTGAFFKRGGGKLPDWLISGVGLALAHHRAPANPYLATLPRSASASLQETKLTDPGQVFADGTFSPAEIGPVGYTLVEFLLRHGNMVQFGQFVSRLQTGSSVETALKDVYQADGKTLAVGYAGTLPGAGKKGKK